MNVKNNQRYQATDSKIRNVLLELLIKKDLSQITVQDICKAAEINRSSFYSHYLDIYDLMEKLEHEMQTGVLKMFEGLGSNIDEYISQKNCEMILRYAAENKVFYRAYMNSYGSAAIERGYRMIFETVFIPYFKKLGIKTESEMMYYFTFFQAGFMTVIKRWLDNDTPESPEVIAQIIWHSIPGAPGSDALA